MDGLSTTTPPPGTRTTSTVLPVPPCGQQQMAPFQGSTRAPPLLKG